MRRHLVELDQRTDDARAVEPGFRLGAIVGGDAGERQAGHAIGEPAREHAADGAEAGDGDAGHGETPHANGVMASYAPAKPATSAGKSRVKRYLDRHRGARNCAANPRRTSMSKKALITGFGLLLATSVVASAQTFPTKPMTMVVPFAAG